MEYKKKYIARSMGGWFIDSPRFDTEIEAIEWAYEKEPKADWMIVPVIEFIND